MGIVRDTLKFWVEHTTKKPEVQTRTTTVIQQWIDTLNENFQGYMGRFRNLRSVREAISRNPYVRRAFEIIKTSIVSLPLKLIDKNGKEVVRGPAAEIIMTSPNHRQSWGEFTEETIGFYLSEGKWFWEIGKDLENKRAISLFNLPADKVQVLSSGDYKNPIAGFQYGGRKFAPDELGYERWITAGDMVGGESPLMSALEDIAVSVALARALRSLAENSSRAGGIITPKNNLDDKDLEKMRAALEELSNPDKSGRFLIAPFDATFSSPFINPHDAQVIETQNAVKEAIFAATGIPKIILEAGASTYENQHEGKKNMYELTILPIISKFESALTKYIAWTFDKTWRIVIDTSGIEALQPRIIEFAQQIPNLKQVYSRDEIRVFGPLEVDRLLKGGDEISGSALEVPVALAPPVEQGKPSPPMDDDEDEKPAEEPIDESDEEEPKSAFALWDRRKGMPVDVQKRPYPNEHACRLREPSSLSDECRRKNGEREHEGKKYDVIYCKEKSGNKWAEQAYRYPKDTWSADEARSHCKDHDGKFEAASEKVIEPQAFVRKAAGGFSGEAREAHFQARLAELLSYRRAFAYQLKKAYKAQERKIENVIKGFDEDLRTATDPHNWLNWEKEQKKMAHWAHPVLLGIVKDAGQKTCEDFELEEKHVGHVTEQTERFTREVNTTTLKKLQEAFSDITSGEYDRIAFDDLCERLEIRQEEDEDEEREEKKTKKGWLLAAAGLIFLAAQGGRTKNATETETHGAQGYGLVEGMIQEGVESYQWVSAFLPTSRPEHMEADGQTRRIGEAFIIGGEALMYPGDLTASPGNICNCICTVMAVIGE